MSYRYLSSGEEAPGKPKVDDSTVAAAAGALDLQRDPSSTPPPSLQLPPALLATLHMKLGAANTSRSTAVEIRSRYSRLAHSGPLELQRWRSDLHVPSCERHCVYGRKEEGGGE